MTEPLPKGFMNDVGDVILLALNQGREIETLKQRIFELEAQIDAKTPANAGNQENHHER